MRNRKINTHENRCKESRERERISSTNRNIKIEKHKDAKSQKIQKLQEIDLDSVVERIIPI